MEIVILISIAEGHRGLREQIKPLYHCCCPFSTLPVCFQRKTSKLSPSCSHTLSHQAVSSHNSGHLIAKSKFLPAQARLANTFLSF